MVTLLMFLSLMLPVSAQAFNHHGLIHALHQSIENHANQNHDHTHHHHDEIEAKAENHHPIIFGETSFTDLFSHQKIVKSIIVDKVNHSHEHYLVDFINQLHFGYGINFSPPHAFGQAKLTKNTKITAQSTYLATQRLRL